MPENVNADSESDDEGTPTKYERAVLDKRSLDSSAVTSEPVAKKTKVLERKALYDSSEEEEDAAAEEEPDRKVRSAVSKLARMVYERMKVGPDNTALAYTKGNDRDFWDSLGIEYTVDEMYEQFRTAGGIKLRSTDDQSVDKLVIGCGNHPYEYRQLGEDSDHAHRDAYTVDKSVSMSPTVLGAFGYANLAQLFLSGVFAQILFEGYSPVDSPGTLDKQPYLVADLTELLAENGKLRMPVGPNGKTRTIVANKSRGKIEVMAVVHDERGADTADARKEMTEAYIKNLVQDISR
jgi:hypothetical protein